MKFKLSLRCQIQKNTSVRRYQNVVQNYELHHAVGQKLGRTRKISLQLDADPAIIKRGRCVDEHK